METKCEQMRTELKRQIDRDTRFTPWMMIVVAVVLPLLEAVLVNVWTDAGCTGPEGTCLVVIGLLHLGVGGLLIWNEFRSKSPIRVLADAADLAEKNCSTQRELDRRVQTYRMYRDAIEEMNAQACTVQVTGAAFDETLRPVIKRFLTSFCDTVGVCSNRYTLEVYLSADLLGDGAAYPVLGDYALAFFDSPTVQSGEVIRMGTVHPVCITSATKHERMIGRVSENPALFAPGGNGNGVPYFEQYATHVIPTQCRSGHLGYVVFTTRQSEPMAPDALEALGLIASVTSSFHSRWFDCQDVRRLRDENMNLSLQLAAPPGAGNGGVAVPPPVAPVPVPRQG